MHASVGDLATPIPCAANTRSQAEFVFDIGRRSRLRYLPRSAYARRGSAILTMWRVEGQLGGVAQWRRLPQDDSGDQDRNRP